MALKYSIMCSLVKNKEDLVSNCFIGSFFTQVWSIDLLSKNTILSIVMCGLSLLLLFVGICLFIIKEKDRKDARYKIYCL